MIIIHLQIMGKSYNRVGIQKIVKIKIYKIRNYEKFKNRKNSGTLNIDGDYDTYIWMPIEELDKEELDLIK